MRTNRFLRVRVIAITLFALLFAQWSVAAYACPSQQLAQMTDCAGMTSLDPALPNLCAAHCHYGEQSDQPRTPAAPAASLVSLYAVPLAPVLAGPNLRHVTASGLLAARPLPHTILHCCFRI